MISTSRWYRSRNEEFSGPWENVVNDSNMTSDERDLFQTCREVVIVAGVIESWESLRSKPLLYIGGYRRNSVAENRRSML